MTGKQGLMIIVLLLAGGLTGQNQPVPAGYECRMVEGWTVYIHLSLVTEKPQLAEEVIKMLGVQLYQITRAAGPKVLEKLRTVRIWVERNNPEVAGMCYHPSPEWLKEHGYLVEKAGGIEMGMPENFLAWSRHQPWMVMHELAHAWHHQVLGYDHEGIKTCFENARREKRYDEVLNHQGQTARAYAMNNDQEYFAEQTEAFWGTNDFYPFVRPELKKQDPNMFKLLEEVWMEK